MDHLIPPSSEETEVVSFTAYRDETDRENRIKKYVFEKSLIRPRTNLWTIGLIMFFYFVAAFLLGYSTISILNLEKWNTSIYVTSYLLCFAIITKFLAIKSIECYQHYAKLTTRRKCLCMPTCSEYAIAVLKKYPIFIAIPKIKKRLLKTCKGDFYKIDPP